MAAGVRAVKTFRDIGSRSPRSADVHIGVKPADATAFFAKVGGQVDNDRDDDP
jgi:hypothetical protein